jgi:hypothetical protein
MLFPQVHKSKWVVSWMNWAGWMQTPLGEKTNWENNVGVVENACIESTKRRSDNAATKKGFISSKQYSMVVVEVKGGLS